MLTTVGTMCQCRVTHKTRMHKSFIKSTRNLKPCQPQSWPRLRPTDPCAWPIHGKIPEPLHWQGAPSTLFWTRQLLRVLSISSNDSLSFFGWRIYRWIIRPSLFIPRNASRKLEGASGEIASSPISFSWVITLHVCDSTNSLDLVYSY